MEIYYYSAKIGTFYAGSLMDAYKNAKSWPDDAVKLDDGDYEKLISGRSSGKIIITGKGGYPKLSEPPPPTRDQLIAAAESNRKILLDEANKETEDWRVELALGIIDDSDKGKLTAWMKYIKALKALDLSSAPDVLWPVIPQ